MDSSCLPLLPPPLCVEGERLLDLSLWCLGRDVCHPDNLLLCRGLTCERLPTGQRGTSAYSGMLGGGGVLTLWGFGALCRVAGQCLLVPRDGFLPVLVDPACATRSVFQAEQLGRWRAPVTPEERAAARTAVVGLAGWLAGHEEWVGARVGPQWRRECVAALRKGPRVPVEGLAEGWRRLAARVEALARPVVNDSWVPLAGA